MEYEQAVDDALSGRRIVGLCTYRHGVGPSNMLDVVRRRDCALERHGRGWQVMSCGPGSLALPTAR
jgi:hypothetical protein